MLHVRSLTAARKAPSDAEPALLAYAIGGGGIAKGDFIADLGVVVSTFLWRKKFEPLPGT